MVDPSCSQPHMGTDRWRGTNFHPTHTVPGKEAPVFGACQG